jgi:hypothetical protein
MSLISSVTTAAAAMATGLDPVLTAAGMPKGEAAGAAALATARALGAPSARLASVAKGRSTAAGKAATATKTAVKASTAKPAASKAAAASAGYASTTADFDFLKDKTLSVEEKLFRFTCAIAQRNDDEVLKKMEEMKGGTAKATGSGGSGSSGGSKKSGGVSVWSALKLAVPVLGLASKVVGDEKLKSMLKQVSGPVLAAAATALGLPTLAPLALSAGPGVLSAILDGKLGGAGAAAGEGAASSSPSGTSGSATATAPTSGKNEQVQLMELQRLVDKQKEMFSMVSNILRAQHDTRMSIIGNVR